MICAKRTAAPFDTITLLPTATDLVPALSSWGIAPVEGDSVLVLDEGKLLGAGDDKWAAHEVRGITAASGNNGCPWKTAADSSPVLFLSDTGRQSFKLAISPALSATSTIMIGAPVRFFRRVRYEIYQAPDQQWYLGYSDCLRTYATASLCSDVTPVSGPYLPYTGIASENGLTFAYFDAAGNALAPTAQSRLVSRVDVLLRAGTTNLVTRTGAGAGEQYRDSVVLSVGIRNRR
jgi:hypothetical protein